MIVLANDPSIAAWGWAVLEIKNKQSRILATGCIKTSKSPKKKRLRASDDLIRRLDIITNELIKLHKEYGIDWVASEAPHGSQSAAAAKMIGAVTGILSGFIMCNKLPSDWFSERDAKKHLLGKISATKQETINAIVKIYGNGWMRGVKYKDEAVADALTIFNIAREKSAALQYAMNQ